MIVMEFVLLCGLCILGSLAIISDLRYGIVPNRLLAIFSIIALGLDTVYYSFYANEAFTLFVVNFITITILSLVLYYTHSLAGGDSKFIPVMALFYPARMYMTYGNNYVTLFVAVCFAIFAGYIYLLLNTIWKIITGVTTVNPHYIRSYIVSFLKNYSIAYCYMILVNLILEVINRELMMVSSWIAWIICIAIVWMVGNTKRLKKPLIILLVVLMDVGLSMFLHVLPISINPQTYIFTAIIMTCQMVIKTNVYETVPTYKIKKGMILSTFSSALMQSSKIKGLPGLSSEDLRNRLTEEEADSIHRWGKSVNGYKEITIVKKVPFTAFIMIGYLGYYCMWRLLA